MLSEGSTLKYFKYAIGEIVLVVIGILIALQINNANETRKINKQLRGYLLSISKNIQSDTTEIMAIHDLRKSYNQVAQDYMEFALQDSTSLKLSRHIGPILGEQYLTVNKSGFDALKNSGYIANLQGSDIEDALLDYYALYEEIHESETSLNNFIESLEAAWYNGDYENISRVFKLLNAESTPIELSERDKRLALEHIFNNSQILGIMQRVADEKYFSVYDSLRSKGQKLITLIEKETPS